MIAQLTQANGQALNPIFYQNLKSINVVDQLGLLSDTCRIMLVPNPSIEPPELGEVLNVALGTLDEAWEVGRYYVNSVRLSDSDLGITAMSTPFLFRRTLRTVPEPRNFEDSQLSAIVGEIIKGSGLQAKVARSLGAVSLEGVAQVNESNAEFLIRLLSENGATYKVREDTIYIDRIGSNESVNSLAKVSVSRDDCISYDFSIQETELFQSAHAYFQDAVAGLTSKVQVGSGDPSFAFKTVFSSEDSAKQACESFLTTRDRTRRKATITIVGRPAVVAGAQCDVSGFDAPFDGSYLLETVTHNYSPRGGYNISVALVDAETK